MNGFVKDFIKGADISFLEEQLDRGALFKDRNGNPVEIYELLKKYGMNGVRFRVWNEPDNVPESGGYCSVEKTVKAIQRAKENGMNVLLDFHYSDYWADPQKQNKPRAWEKLSFDELVEAVYDFTRDTLLKLAEKNILPDIVQIGNEIRNGMLWDDGILEQMIKLGDESHGKPGTEQPRDGSVIDECAGPTRYGELARLVNAGIRAVRDICGDDRAAFEHSSNGSSAVPAVMIHLDEGANYSLLEKWFDEMNINGLDEFDVIGLSYYPHFHGKIASLKDAVDKLAIRYAKPIYIVETAHPWRFLENGFVTKEALDKTGLPASKEAQKAVLDQVFQITADIPNGLGRGVYFWEPAIIAADSGYAANMGVFDENGTALPAIESFLFMP